MIKQIQFQNNYNVTKDMNRVGVYVSFRYDTQKKTLTLVDKFNGKATNIEVASLADTEKYKNVDELIEQIKNLDLSSFALKTDIPTKLSELINDLSLDVDLSQYAKVTDIPDTSNFATKDQLPDLSNYALKSQIPSSGISDEEFVNKLTGLLETNRELRQFLVNILSN